MLKFNKFIFRNFKIKLIEAIPGLFFTSIDTATLLSPAFAFTLSTKKVGSVMTISSCFSSSSLSIIGLCPQAEKTSETDIFGHGTQQMYIQISH